MDIALKCCANDTNCAIIECGGKIIIPDSDLLAKAERQAAEHVPPPAEGGYTLSEETARLTNAINREPERPEDMAALILQGNSAYCEIFIKHAMDGDI